MPASSDPIQHGAAAAMRRLVERLAGCEPADGWYSALQLPTLKPSDYATILRAAPEALWELRFPVGLLVEALATPDEARSTRLVRALGQALEPVLRHKLLAALIEYADAHTRVPAGVRGMPLRTGTCP